MSAVRIAPGVGYVFTQRRSLLYLPSWHDGLAGAFGEGDDAGVARRIASVAIDSGFDIEPFVCMSWVDQLHVMVFGDVEVETSLAALPMLSGAASRTWVERSVELTDDLSADVWVGAEIDEHTAVSSGTALAGGFRLELRPSGRVPSSSTTGEPTQFAAPTDATAATGIEIDPDDADNGADGDGERVADSAPESSSATPGPSASPPTSRSTIDPIDGAAAGADGGYGGAKLETLGSPAVGYEAMVSASSATDLLDEAADSGVTLPPPRPHEVRVHEAVEGGPPLVEAKPCSLGHPNPPSSASCEICAESLSPNEASIVHVTRPSLGEIELDDGTHIELTDELVLGRNPSADTDSDRADFRHVSVGGDKVSRVHAEVRLRGWDVLVGDCGSTNGTYVVPHTGSDVVQLEPGRLHRIDDGATVYFGSRSFVLHGRHRV